jgi:hypothetical protein
MKTPFTAATRILTLIAGVIVAWLSAMSVWPA